MPGLRSGCIVFLLSLCFVDAGGTGNGNVIPPQEAHSTVSKSPTIAAFRTGRTIARLSILLVHVGSADNVNMKRKQPLSLANDQNQASRNEHQCDLTVFAPCRSNLSGMSMFLVHRGTGDNVDMKRTHQFQSAKSTPAVAVDSKPVTKKFEVIVAPQVPAYMTLEVEASNESEAVTKAKKRIEGGEFDVDIDALCYNEGWKIGYPDEREVSVVWSQDTK